MKVCMFVADDCHKYKIAVRKLARTLAEAGHDVRVIAILNKETEPYEESDGARIFRVALNPIPRKILRLLRLPAKMAPKLSYLVRLLLQKLFPRSFEAVMQGTADSGLQQRGVKNFIRGKYDFARRALRENPAYFLTVGWLLGAGFVLLGLIGLPFWWLYNLWYRFTRRPILRLSYRYLSYLDYYYRSYRLARQEPADVYHAHDLVTLPVAWLCSRLTGGKLVYDSHELWLDYPGRQRSRFNRFIVQRIESFLIRRTDANIAPGESVGQELSRRYHMVPTVILNVPYYRPFQRSTVFRDKLGIPAEAKIVLYMGMIFHFRGIEEGIRSLKYLSNCSLVIFGFGPEQYVSGLRELIRNEGVTDRVHFADAVPFDEITRYAMSADVSLVLHKNVGLGYYYVSPNKLFESMAAGLPVVGSNFPDLKMYIEGYGLGITCDPDNPKEIADAIDDIFSDEKRYEEMRRNALEAAKIFSWENESKKLLAIYEGLRDRMND